MGTIVCAAGAGTPLGVVALSGRAEAPAARQAAAASALSRSRLLASAWAAAELREAEGLYRDAERAFRREAARPYPWRDYGAAGDALWRAERAAHQALRLAEERRAVARADAEDALADASDLLVHAGELSRTMALPPRTRERLARARLVLGEAHLLFEDGELVRAAERAGAARGELFAALGGVLEVARRYTAAEQLETWRRWTEQTRAWSRSSGRPAVIVYKEKNELLLLQAGEPVARYRADVGANGLHAKLRQGDRATPEGRYRIVSKRGPGQSQFHKALLLDYPTAEDRRRLAEARRAGDSPTDADPGGLIEIHGEGGRGRNWTDGCVALANDDMDDLFIRVEEGSWVTIVGGDGQDGAFSRLVSRLESPGSAP